MKNAVVTLPPVGIISAWPRIRLARRDGITWSCPGGLKWSACTSTVLT